MESIGQLLLIISYSGVAIGLIALAFHVIKEKLKK